MITNHIIIRRPSGNATICGPIAHRILFRAAAELEKLRETLPLGRHIFAPQPKSGVIVRGEFRSDQWTVGPRVKAGVILSEDLVIDVEVEP